MKNEIWRSVKDYEDMYQVSNLGRVKSLKFRKERILKPGTCTSGYLFVNLHKNNEVKQYLVHRLVAQTFIPNPNNWSQVNHKNEVKTDNRLENLEWCSAKYNNNYGTHNQRISEKLSKPVLQYSKDGQFIREWKSIRDIERTLNYNEGNISECCRGKRKSAYGFIWKYKD